MKYNLLYPLTIDFAIFKRINITLIMFMIMRIISTWIFDDLFFVEAAPNSSKTLLMQYEKWYKLHVSLHFTSSSRRNKKKSNKFILIILPYYKMILISLYMKWKFVVFIFILLVKVLPHSNFRGFHAFYFSLYKLSPKMVCSKKPNSLSIHVR